MDAAAGGEDRDDFVQRAVAVMTDIVANHPEQTVAVVSHGGTLGVYLAHLLEMPIHRSLPFQFDNTSLSIVKAERAARPAGQAQRHSTPDERRKVEAAHFAMPPVRGDCNGSTSNVWRH